jgi:hypothetical protein
MDVAAAVTAQVAAVDTHPADELKEWIRLNRRAVASPAPTPTSTATAVPKKVVAEPSTPFGAVLPSVDSLRNTGVPVLVYATFLTLLVLLVRGVLREVRSARRK